MEKLPTKLVCSTVHTAPPGQGLAASFRQGSDAGFSSFLVSEAHCSLGTPDLARSLRRDRLRIAVVRTSAPDAARVDGFTDPRWLASSDPEGRREAVLRARRLAEAAAALGCRTVILRAGFVPVPNAPLHHDALAGDVARGRSPAPEAVQEIEKLLDRHEEEALDRTCRSLFEICRRHPEIRFCLEPAGAFHEIPRSRHLPLLWSDLRAPNLAYWHDPVRCRSLERLGFDREEAWLDATENRLAGISLHDARGGETGLPPGAGEIDFRRLAFYAPGCDWLSLEIRPSWDAATTEEAVRFLRGRGIAPPGH
jgi:sugar phosphate isomerase/epimerase